MKRRHLLAVNLLVSAVAWTACGSTPRPETLFDEAETLRVKYEKDASHGAIEKFRAAIVQWERQGQTRDAARAWERVAATYWQLGAPHRSLDAYESALSLLPEGSDSLLESEIRSQLGIAQAYTANDANGVERARSQCERALVLAQSAGGDSHAAKR